MKLLVTGGLGFIGSNFIRYMLNKYPNIKITNLDKITYCGNPDNLKDIKKKYKFVKGDICDKNLMNKLIKNNDIIINFAAETHVDRSITDTNTFMRTNVYGIFVLLEAVKKHKKKLIHISTDEVYGSIAKGSFKETDKLKPSSTYSVSKALADILVLSYYKKNKIKAVITRSSNNFGPYQYPEKIIPLFITNLLEKKKIPLYGDGLNIRDWIYVRDNCRALELIMRKGVFGNIYNIAGNNEKTNLEITKLILKELKKDKTYIQYVKDRPKHDRRYSINSNKLKKIGFKPKYNFNKALKETISWYKNNQSWWKKIKSGSFKKYYKEHYKKHGLK